MAHVTSRVAICDGNLSIFDENGASLVVHALADMQCRPDDPTAPVAAASRAAFSSGFDNSCANAGRHRAGRARKGRCDSTGEIFTTRWRLVNEMPACRQPS
jgi:hypothetical protein